MSEICTKCDLHLSAESICMKGYGNPSAKVMIIGGSPGLREDEIGKPFQGKVGKVLDRVLHAQRVTRESLFLTNVVRCKPPKSKSPKKKEIGACREWLLAEIERVNPDFVLVLGNTAAKGVFNELSKFKMGDIRGRFTERDGRMYFATYHPSVEISGISKYLKIMESDFKRFFEVVKLGKLPEGNKLNLTIVNSIEDYEEFLKVLRKEDEVAFDIETTGLVPWEGNIVSLGFGFKDQEFVIPMNHGEGWLDDEHDEQSILCEEIEGILQDKILIAHNGKFDTLWTKVQYGMDLYLDHDTMLLSHLLDENTGNGLKYLSETLLGAENYEISLSAKKGGTTLELLAEYNAWDVYYTLRLYKRFIKELKEDPALCKFYEYVTMPAARYFRDIEHHGVYLNLNKLDIVEEKYEKKIEALAEELEKIKPGVNWNSPKQVSSFLFKDLRLTPLEKTKGGGFSTAESVMQRLARKHPAPKKILELRGARKMLSTFISSWKDKEIDSRLHPSFKLHGTRTGRLCLSGDTPIMTPKGDIMIQDIKPGDLVYSYDENQELTLDKVKWSGCTGYKPVYQLNWYLGNRSNNVGGFLIATGNHPIRVNTGEYVAMEDLKKGQSLMALQRSHKMGYHHLKIFGDSVKSRAEHRVIYKILNGYFPEEVHHIDGNRANNDPFNLEGTTKSKHMKTHQTHKEASRRAKLGHSRNGEYMVKRTIEARKEWSQKYLSEEDALEAYNNFEDQDHRSEKAAKSVGVSRKCLNYRLADMGIGGFKKRNNHRVKSVKKLPGLHEVYDIELEKYHNFIADEICVHNSCTNPNLQQFPRDPEIRSLVSAPDGWTLIEADFSQVELRIAAILSGDKAMQKAFNDGEDIHTKTAIMVSGIDPTGMNKQELKEWRKKAKATNFGFLYGMGAKKFQEYARDKYDINYGIEECKNIRDRFFKSYSGLKPWYERQYRIARMNSGVRGLTGRVRHLPDIHSGDGFLKSQAERQSVNAVVQGFASDLTIMAVIEIMSTFSEGTLNIVGTVHDAILMEIKDERLNNVIPKVKYIMENPAILEEFGIKLPIPIIADIAVGDWGKGEEWEG